MYLLMNGERTDHSHPMELSIAACSQDRHLKFALSASIAAKPCRPCWPET